VRDIPAPLYYTVDDAERLLDRIERMGPEVVAPGVVEGDAVAIKEKIEAYGGEALITPVRPGTRIIRGPGSAQRDVDAPVSVEAWR
jgi:hypothetical protein